MKVALLLTLSFLTFNSYSADISFYNSSYKTEIEITSATTINYITYLQDIKGRTRFEVSAQEDKSLSLIYTNSKGVVVGKATEKQDTDLLRNVLKSATSECPVKIQIIKAKSGSAEAIEILSVYGACDLLAAAENVDNNG